MVLIEHLEGRFLHVVRPLVSGSSFQCISKKNQEI